MELAVRHHQYQIVSHTAVAALQTLGCDLQGMPPAKPMSPQPRSLSSATPGTFAGNQVHQSRVGLYAKRLRTIISDEPMPRPSMRAYDLAQPGSVFMMDGLHARMIAIKQRAIGCELSSHPKIIFLHGEEFVAQWLIL
jgi:hypothetical protein